MSLQKREIILNEIKFWRANRLLPEQYCDFLMTLYSRGEGEESDPAISPGRSVLGKAQTVRLWLGCLAAALVIALLALLFLARAVVVPIAASASAVAGFLLLSLFLAKRRSSLLPVLFIASAILLLAMSAKVWAAYFSDKPPLLIALLMANCVTWTVAGVKLKLPYFTLSGTLGLMLAIGYTLYLYTA